MAKHVVKFENRDVRCRFKNNSTVGNVVVKALRISRDDLDELTVRISGEKVDLSKRLSGDAVLNVFRQKVNAAALTEKRRKR